MRESSAGRRARGWRALAIALAGAGLAVLSGAPGRAVEDPADDERLHHGAISFQNNCLICHGEEMTNSQRLTPAQWKAEVEKMIGWGAPVPPEEVEALTHYLTATFPPDGEGTQPALAPLAELDPGPGEIGAGGLPQGNPAEGGVLYERHCAECHGRDGQGALLGPNLVERPVLLREADWIEVLREGRRRMPGFKMVLNPQHEADLLAWLRPREYKLPAADAK